jgi:hypothetical protein
MDTINLGTAGRRITFKDEHGKDYFIDIAEGKYLLVSACIEYGRAAFNFDHRNVLARIPEVFEYKHYRANGGKRWTSAPGIDIVFALPKTAIEVVPEPGYSYVKVKIAGEDFTLNVSGGTGTGGWTDWIGAGAHLCGTRKTTVKKLKALASVAFDPASAVLLGIRLPEYTEDDKQSAERLPRVIADRIIPAMVKDGYPIHLTSSYSGEYVYRVKYRSRSFYADKASRKRSFICDYKGSNLRVKFSQIDWVKTAALNDFPLPTVEPVFRIPFMPKAPATATA